LTSVSRATTAASSSAIRTSSMLEEAGSGRDSVRKNNINNGISCAARSKQSLEIGPNCVHEEALGVGSFRHSPCLRSFTLKVVVLRIWFCHFDRSLVRKSPSRIDGAAISIGIP
jgi:hypothetical protein